MSQEAKVSDKIPLQKGFTLFRRFLPFLKGERRLAVWIGVLLVASLPIGVVPPFLVRRLIDEVLELRQRVAVGSEISMDLRRFLQQGALIVGLTLSSRVIGYVQSILSLRVRGRVKFRVSAELFRHVLRLPLNYFHHTSTGYLMSRVRDDVKALDQLLWDALLGIVVDAIKAILCLFLLLWLDAVLALSGLILVVLVFGSVLAVSPALRRRSERTREADAKSSGRLQEALSGILTVRTSAQERREARTYMQSVQEWIRAATSRDLLGAITGSAVGLIGVLGGYVIILVAAWRILEGRSTFGSLLAFFLILFQMVGAAGAVMSMVPGIQQALASLQRIFALLDEPAEKTVSESGTRWMRPRGAIEWRCVTLQYEGGVVALSDVSLAVAPGEIVALVGRSGAGKTSLVHLIPRLHEPSRGEVLLDGKPLASYPIRWLRAQIGVVPQEVFLFNRTVRENLAYARPNASDTEMREAARAANAEEFILRLQLGYDTLVGERGVRLSGGQKQRLAIAREVLRDPPILILDEATSNLDSESEILVREAIRRLMRGRTCLVIAHRLSTLQDAHRVIVLEGGRVIEQGAPADLLSRDSHLSRLAELQAFNAEALGTSAREDIGNLRDPRNQ